MGQGAGFHAHGRAAAPRFVVRFGGARRCRGARAGAIPPRRATTARVPRVKALAVRPPRALPATRRTMPPAGTDPSAFDGSATSYSITPDRTAPTEGAVDRPCEPDCQPAHATRQEPAVICLDDEVKMIVLNRIVDDPEPPVGGHGQRAPDGRKDPAGAEAANGVRGSEGDVYGMGGSVLRSGPVRHTRTAPRSGLTARAWSSPAPGRGNGKRELDGAPWST
jgi:hypothetical protein